MNKTIKKVFLIIFMSIFCFMPMKVNAENGNFNLNLTSSSSKISAGDEVIITIGISDIDAGENGIGALKLKLDYDDSKFEKITSKDITYKNNWNDIVYNENTKILILLQDNLPYTKTDEEVCTIKLKAKDIKRNEKINFAVKEIEGSNSENTIVSSDLILEFNSSSSNVSNTVIYVCITSALIIIAVIAVILLFKKRANKRN